LPESPEASWALALFNRSVLKQAKYRRILELLEDPAGKTSLDIGADNGVISYLLRQRGGTWYSADLDPAAVASIRNLVGDHVFELSGSKTPFAPTMFDQVVVVDYLEHIADDAGFVGELERILKPGGTLIVNVPQHRRGSWLERLRHAIGLTDEWHGHVRPGYRPEDLRRLLEPGFVIERCLSYSKLFSELIDTALNGFYLRTQAAASVPSAKGPVITSSDLRKYRKQFALLSFVYPVLWVLSKLDALLWFRPGYKLMVKATRRG
jgi:SAM-dependent methyltransferase